MIGSVADQCWKLQLEKAPRASKAVQKLVLLAYASHANVEGRSIYPGALLVSKRTGLDRDTVKRAVKVLEAAGVLVQVTGPQPHKNTEWRLGDWFDPSDTWVEKRRGPAAPSGGPAASRGGGHRPPEVKNLKGSLKKPDFSLSEDPKPDPELNALGLANVKAVLEEKKRQRARVRKAPK